jgi:hypothetical protein
VVPIGLLPVYTSEGIIGMYEGCGAGPLIKLSRSTPLLGLAGDGKGAGGTDWCC